MTMSEPMLDDPGYQEFLAETAKWCRAKYRPCPGCCAGGMCDGFLERDDEPEDDRQEDLDENGVTP